MKTISLKMLLVAALVVSPVAMAHPENVNSAAVATKGSILNSAYSSVCNAGNTVYNAGKNAGKTVVNASSDAYQWAQDNKLKVAAVIIAGVVVKQLYSYMNAPAKTNKTVNAN